MLCNTSWAVVCPNACCQEAGGSNTCVLVLVTTCDDTTMMCMGMDVCAYQF